MMMIIIITILLLLLLLLLFSCILASSGFSSLQICRLKRSRTASQYSDAVFIRANFSETLPYTSGLLTSTSFGAQISKTFWSHVNLYRQSEVRKGGGYHTLRSRRLDKIETKFIDYPHVFGGGGRNSTVLLGILSDVTGSQKSKMAASNLEMRISRLVDMIAKTF